jgi:hypothetical protein
VLCSEEIQVTVNSANSQIRQVNAAMYVCAKVPPPTFRRVDPMRLKDHVKWNKGKLLRKLEMPGGTANSMKWDSHPAGTQTQLIAHHYYVRTAPKCTALVLSEICCACACAPVCMLFRGMCVICRMHRW